MSRSMSGMVRLSSVRKRSKRRSCAMGSTLVMSSTYATIESAAELREVERAGVGGGGRVAQRLVVAAETLAQHDLVLEPVLAVRLQAVAGLVERGAEVDAAQHVVQAAARRPRVVDVVGDDRPEP